MLLFVHSLESSHHDDSNEWLDTCMCCDDNASFLDASYLEPGFVASSPVIWSPKFVANS